MHTKQQKTLKEETFAGNNSSNAQFWQQKVNHFSKYYH